MRAVFDVHLTQLQSHAVMCQVLIINNWKETACYLLISNPDFVPLFTNTNYTESESYYSTSVACKVGANWKWLPSWLVKLVVYIVKLVIVLKYIFNYLQQYVESNALVFSYTIGWNLCSLIEILAPLLKRVQEKWFWTIDFLYTLSYLRVIFEALFTKCTNLLLGGSTFTHLFGVCKILF